MAALSLATEPPPGAALAMAVRPGVIPASLAAAAAAARFTGAAAETAVLVGPERVIVLAGLGAADGVPSRQGVPPGPGPGQGAVLRAAGAAAVAALADAGLGAIATLALDGRDLPPDAALAFAEGAALRAWRFDRYRATDPEPERAPPRDVVLLADGAALGAGWRALRARMAGVDLARDLVSEPANRLNPSSFVDRLAPLRAAGIAIRTLDARALAREGCGALLAVGQGSAHPPRLAVLRWPGRSAQADPLVFVGKGLTFDTGGICIKPAAGMEEMRADMAGAAACAGALLSLALQDAAMPAMAVLAIAENMTSGASYRPGDVLRSASGRSIEVVDTDAEGRLALADALAYAAKRLRPRALIDLATLTGAIITALGHEKAGLFASHEGLAGAIAAAGAAVGEPVWRMPIGEAHRSDLDSDIADLRHCLPGHGHPDACHAAAFLREFTAGLPWAHLDIASVETWAENDERHAAGASGFGVRLLDALALRLGTMPAEAWQ